MIANMRRLYPRGAANRGICVDAEGAMLGPECVLVERSSSGFRAIGRDDAAGIQRCAFGVNRDRDWLFRQCQHIADALNKGEVALAQIYGLQIPIDNLDDSQLWRTELAKAGFNPDEPRIPKGEPHAGEWTTGGADEADTGGDEGSGGAGAAAPITIAFESVPGATSSGGGAPSASSDTGPIQWDFKPIDSAPPAASNDGGQTGASAKPSSSVPKPSTRDSPDLRPGVPIGSDPETGTGKPILDVPGIDAINPDYSLENLLLFLATRGSRGALRRGLQAPGLLGKDEDAHHIVPKEDVRTDPARKVLERFGIGIHEPINGVGLPKTQHWQLNSNAYHEWINQSLAGARTRAEVEDILRSLARKLKDGVIP